MPRAVYAWDTPDPVEKALNDVRSEWDEFAHKVVEQAGRPDAGGRVTFSPDHVGPVGQYRIVYELAHPGEEAFITESFTVRDRRGDATCESAYLAVRIRDTLPRAKRAIEDWGI